VLRRLGLAERNWTLAGRRSDAKAINGRGLTSLQLAVTLSGNWDQSPQASGHRGEAAATQQGHAHSQWPTTARTSRNPGTARYPDNIASVCGDVSAFRALFAVPSGKVPTLIAFGVWRPQIA
jgi:hypothetical protein